MREIKVLDIRKGNDSRGYRYSLFECPICNKQVEKVRKDGLKAKQCSHKCYSQNRGVRGAYKESVLISGYKYIRCPEHPFATKKGYVAEHRLVAEKLLGRYLREDEDVHHENFNKLDNRPENITVFTKSKHSKIHQKHRKRDTYGKYAV